MTRTEVEDCDLTDVKRRLSSKSETNVSRCPGPNQARCQRYGKTNNVNKPHRSIMANNVQRMLNAGSISRLITAVIGGWPANGKLP